MSKIELTEKNKLRLRQFYVERQRIEEIIQHTILTIMDASDVEYEPTDKITIEKDFNYIEIEKTE